MSDVYVLELEGLTRTYLSWLLVTSQNCQFRHSW